jgi:hypothetical protein
MKTIFFYEKVTCNNIFKLITESYDYIPNDHLHKYKYGYDGLKLFIGYENHLKLISFYENNKPPFLCQQTELDDINHNHLFNGYKVITIIGLPESTFFWGYDLNERILVFELNKSH